MLLAAAGNNGFMAGHIPLLDPLQHGLRRFGVQLVALNPRHDARPGEGKFTAYWQMAPQGGELLQTSHDTSDPPGILVRKR